MSRRKPRYRPWIWTSLILLIAALALGSRYWNQPLQVVRLKDGSTFRLEAVTYGTEHR